MRQSMRDEPRQVVRTTRIESFEPRLAMSAHPVGQFALDYTVNQVDVGDLVTTQADASDLTGLAAARNAYGFSGLGQTVAVIDSGIAYDHEALGGGLGDGFRVVGGWDFTEENDANPYDDGPFGAHGTHVAGIIASDDPLNMGVAPEVDLVALRVFNDEGNGYFGWIEDALRWVHTNRDSFENPITTVNLSIGTMWNSDDIPSWAMLEDEFAMLEADGIFISVAAGNSFTTYNDTGLSYPAVSQYVVPVASVDADGDLSYFSQRNSRVIAAPGRGIMSTVPDYLGDRDGQADDFARFSGTSMAAPYVAGASVLMREALQFTGASGITQDQLYEIMYNTADTVFDSATGQNYQRLNIGAALDAIMPSDDYGSSVSTAYYLGSISDDANVSGLIGRRDDADFFSFTAAQSGTATFTVAADAGVLPTWELAGGGAQVRSQSDTLEFDVIAGQTYTVALSTADGIGYYRVDAEIEASYVDWGVVDFQRLTGQNLAGGGRFAMVASQDGRMTVEGFFARAGGDLQFELYDSRGVLVGTSNELASGERLDADVRGGETYYLHVPGSNGNVDFRLTNLVSLDAGRLEINGTAGNDTFAFNAGGSYRISINGVAYEFGASVVSTVTFYGAGGNDSAQLTGTAANEVARVGDGRGKLFGDGYTVAVEGVGEIAISGGGGSDRAFLYGTSGNDQLITRPGWAQLTGPGYVNTVAGFSTVKAYAGAGYDTAVFYDSIGNDRFFARPDMARLTGAGFSNTAIQFDVTRAYAGAGNDEVVFYDSNGDDEFFARPDMARMSGARFMNYAKNFDSVGAFAGQGNDTAILYDSRGDDYFFATPVYAYLKGQGFSNLAKNFDTVRAYAGSGNDRAEFRDSSGNDSFYARPEYASLSGDGFFNYAKNFDTVDADASEGFDTAQLVDSALDDVLLVARAATELRGATFANRVSNFDRVDSLSTGGNDRAAVQDTAFDDWLVLGDGFARLSSLGLDNWIYAFESITAYGIAGGVNSADIDAADSLFQLRGDWV